MVSRRRFLLASACASAGVMGLRGLAIPCAAAEPDSREYEQMVTRGIGFLATKGQASDGSYNAAAGPGVTALVTTSILRHGRSPSDPLVARSIKYIEGFIGEDGGIHAKESAYKNYETCLAILCFTEANQDGKYNTLLKKADAFIKGTQWDEGESKDPSDTFYGGAGYGGHKRPDLSNTQFLLDALKATGNDENSEAVQKALIFVSRCQNLETEHNTTPFAAKVNDGGFYYTPAAGGTSQAGTTANGGLRSYASMTYAGLKSMIYAGVKEDDPRVQAAVKWLKKNYDLDSNPGMGDAGLYYYYHTFAKALSALGQDKFTDDAGVEHDWRAELIAELASRQRKDGSWANDNSRWLEGDASLCTAYCLLALSYCRNK